MREQFVRGPASSSRQACMHEWNVYGNLVVNSRYHDELLSLVFGLWSLVFVFFPAPIHSLLITALLTHLGKGASPPARSFLRFYVPFLVLVPVPFFLFHSPLSISQDLTAGNSSHPNPSHPVIYTAMNEIRVFPVLSVITRTPHSTQHYLRQVKSSQVNLNSTQLNSTPSLAFLLPSSTTTTTTTQDTLTRETPLDPTHLDHNPTYGSDHLSFCRETN